MIITNPEAVMAKCYICLDIVIYTDDNPTDEIISREQLLRKPQLLKKISIIKNKGLHKFCLQKLSTVII